MPPSVFVFFLTKVSFWIVLAVYLLSFFAGKLKKTKPQCTFININTQNPLWCPKRKSESIWYELFHLELSEKILCIWYTNGNVIVHGMVTWEPERGFESSCCKNTNSNTKFKVRQIQLHVSCQRFRENWWGVRRVSLWNCEAEKPGNQDVFVCSAPNRTLCFKHSVSNTMHCATMFALPSYLVGTPADFGMCHIVSLSRAHWGVLRVGFTFIRVTALNPHSGCDA